MAEIKPYILEKDRAETHPIGITTQQLARERVRTNLDKIIVDFEALPLSQKITVVDIFADQIRGIKGPTPKGVQKMFDYLYLVMEEEKATEFFTRQMPLAEG